MASQVVASSSGLTLARSGPFARFLWSRVAGQTAQNALLYALLIVVVERSQSSLHSTLLVVAFVLPSIVLGVPGGALSDVLPRRLVLTGVLLLRAAIALALLWSIDNLHAVYLLVLLLATVGQLSGPAEAALVPELLPQERLARGNAAMQFTLIAAQVLGAVILAPLLLRLAGVGAVVALSMVLFLIAAWQMLRVRAMPCLRRPCCAKIARRVRLRAALAAGWRATVDDPLLRHAMIRLTVISAVLKVLVAVAPVLARDVLNIATANTIYVMAPAALGSLLGLALAPGLARRLGYGAAGSAGFVLFGLATLAFAYAVPVGQWLGTVTSPHADLIARFSGMTGVVMAAMLFAACLGLAYAVVIVAVRTQINERAPRTVQGRVIATQLTVVDLLSLPPLLAAGLLADRVGVMPVLLAMGLLCTGTELLIRRRALAVAVSDPVRAVRAGRRTARQMAGLGQVALCELRSAGLRRPVRGMESVPALIQAEPAAIARALASPDAPAG